MTKDVTTLVDLIAGRVGFLADHQGRSSLATISAVHRTRQVILQQVELAAPRTEIVVQEVDHERDLVFDVLFAGHSKS